jgi:hypothetical protein
MLFEERCRPIRRRQEEHKNLLRPLKRRLEGLHLPWRIAVLALILTASLTALMDRTHATGRGSVDAAKHHAGTRPHVTKGRVHVVKHHAGHSPRKALKRKKLRSALMPPAPTDFGPHFDFPPALNDSRLLPKRDELTRPALYRFLIGATGCRVVRHQMTSSIWRSWSSQSSTRNGRSSSRPAIQPCVNK